MCEILCNIAISAILLLSHERKYIMKKVITISCTIFSLCLLLTSCGNLSNSEKADENGNYGTSTATSTITTNKNNNNNSDTKKSETDKKGLGQGIGEAVDTAIQGAETIVSDIVSDIS